MQTKSNNKVHELKTNKGEIYIHNTEIIYIQASNKKCFIFCTDNKIHEVNHSLKQLEQKLFTPTFFRVHHSYLVNCSYVEYVNHSINLYYNNYKYLVPLSKSRVKEFKNNLVRFKELKYNKISI